MAQHHRNGWHRYTEIHKLAHIICEHEHGVTELPVNLPFGLREFNILQEDEAQCLGSTLQLPRECLLWARSRNMNKHEIGEYYNSSIEMVTYRLNSTAVDRQLHYRRK